VQLYNRGGRTYADVARLLGEYPNFVKRAVKRFKKTGDVKNEKGAGRPRKLEGKVLARVLRNRKSGSTRAAARHMEREEGESVSHMTVWREAKRKGLSYRVRRQQPQLTQRHRDRRIAFANRHHDRSFWKRVVAVDEKTFSLYSDTRGVWVRKGEHPPPRETKKWPGGLKVWAGSCWYGKTRLHFLPKSFSGSDYQTFLREEAVDDLLALYPDHSRRPILLQDGDGFHMANCVKNFLRKSPIFSFEDYPSRSPDLNWQENVWEMVLQGLRLRHPTTMEGLKIALEEEWEKLPLSKIRSCVASMPRRLKAVITARGGNTRY